MNEQAQKNPFAFPTTMLGMFCVFLGTVLGMLLLEGLFYAFATPHVPEEVLKVLQSKFTLNHGGSVLDFIVFCLSGVGNLYLWNKWLSKIITWKI